MEIGGPPQGELHPQRRVVESSGRTTQQPQCRSFHRLGPEQIQPWTLKSKGTPPPRRVPAEPGGPGPERAITPLNTQLWRPRTSNTPVGRGSQQPPNDNTHLRKTICGMQSMRWPPEYVDTTQRRSDGERCASLEENAHQPRSQKKRTTKNIPKDLSNSRVPQENLQESHLESEERAKSFW
ncbi:uncharacterized protein LOC122842867 isoform X2 [Gambusia affinis]|uniref:uncharacterized protein LOC122842867 isoform X2 n=1 Tax=Gambusia affinis TaxID=33528 RepID=UPI001CDBBC9D|nr:uncharacterized protein LOC122842867 isoform X2 [Gambusia affinis]